MIEFLSQLSGWEWALIIFASWTILAVLIAPRVGRELKARFEHEEDDES